MQTHSLLVLYFLILFLFALEYQILFQMLLSLNPFLFLSNFVERHLFVPAHPPEFLKAVEQIPKLTFLNFELEDYVVLKPLVAVELVE